MIEGFFWQKNFNEHVIKVYEFMLITIPCASDEISFMLNKI